MARADRGALDVAARALAARDLSRAALARRLASAGFDDGDRRAAVEWLADAGIVDDLRLARSRAERLAERGWGNAGIAARLAADGIGREEVGVALAHLEPEGERALALAARSRSVPPRRLATRLRARGFGEDAIRASLQRLSPSDHLDEPDAPELP